MFLRLTFLTILFVSSASICAQDPPLKPADPGKLGAKDKPNGEADKKEQEKTQDSERKPQDREAREIFFRTLSETRSRGAQEFSYLLFQESVRKEIDLSEDCAREAREILSRTRSSAEKLYDQLKAKQINSDELKVKMLEIMTNADRDIWKALGESNAKSDRLIGLYVQLRHHSAVLNKIVAEKVGLDEVRRHEIIAKKEAVERELFEERSRDVQTPGDRFRAWEKVQKKIDGVVSEMLSQEQRDNLEKLKGKPFAFEEFSPPPGPPGRGREGGRDRNRRENGHDEKCKDSEKLADDR